MSKSDTKTNLSIIFSIASIFIGLIAFVSKEDRILIIGMFFVVITLYFLYDAYIKLDENLNDIKNLKNNIKKLDEKLKIHENLIDIKSDIKNLKREVFKK